MEQSEIEASSRIELDDGTVLTRCDQCRTMHGERNPPTEPPCHGCLVDLFPENEDVARVYLRVRGQIITAPAGKDRTICTLSIPAIKTVMDLYGVENQRECMERVMALWHHFQGLDDEG